MGWKEKNEYSTGNEQGKCDKLFERKGRIKKEKEKRKIWIHFSEKIETFQLKKQKRHLQEQ